MARSVIIDTDPGQDDAVAILLALASPAELDVRGIVTVAGNVPLARTTHNALKILELAGRTDIPVHAGCDRPMHRALVTAEHVHGPTGLDGPHFPEPGLRTQEEHGVDFLRRTLRTAEPGSITLCTLGPLTNVATALALEPEIAAGIAEIVMMAGAYFEVGNITPAAEFNVHVDPEAADLVLRSGVKLTVIPLDLTHQMLATKPRLERIAAVGNQAGRAVGAMLAFSEQFDRTKYGWDGAPLHDPCVIAHLLEPTLFQGRQINVAVETASELTRGMTVADWWQITDRPRNAFWLREGDAEAFYALLTDRIARLP